MRGLALAALVAVLAALALWFLARERRGAEHAVATAALERSEEPGAEADLSRPAPVAAAVMVAESVAAPEPADAREPAVAPVPSGILRGRLVEAGSGAPLAAERVLTLATPGNRVAETLRSRADGVLTSTRAFPKGPVRAWVRDPVSGAVVVQHEAEFDPESAAEWCVPVPAPVAPETNPAPEPTGTWVRGRVVTHSGRGAKAALVKALPREPGRSAVHGDTDADGGFSLRVGPGAHRLLAQGAFASSAPLDLEVVEGLNDAGLLVLPVEDSPGPIRGRLVSDGGGVDPFGFVLVREPASGREVVVAPEWKLFGKHDNLSTTFEVIGLPPGEYELSLVAVDGRRYEPELVRVSPPAEGLEFRTLDRDGEGYLLDLRAAGSRAALADGTALARTRGQWFGWSEDRLTFPRVCERWIAYAPGRRPGRGDFGGGEPFVDEKGSVFLRTEVVLSPGYGLAILFKDAESARLVAPGLEGVIGAGLADVEVLADGAVVARSDADGLALLDLVRAPERIEFRKSGWRVAGEREEDGVRWVHMIRE